MPPSPPHPHGPHGAAVAQGGAGGPPFGPPGSPPDDGNTHPKFPLLGSNIADDVAHDTKKASIARAQQGIDSRFAFAFDFAFVFFFALQGSRDCIFCICEQCAAQTYFQN